MNIIDIAIWPRHGCVHTLIRFVAVEKKGDSSSRMTASWHLRRSKSFHTYSILCRRKFFLSNSLTLSTPPRDHQTSLSFSFFFFISFFVIPCWQWFEYFPCCLHFWFSLSWKKCGCFFYIHNCYFHINRVSTVDNDWRIRQFNADVRKY